ncbi:MAG: DUF2399 domain-containing protein [Enterocloster asparagiformis]|nr:DUF2399 domain-containing protein [Enterocloster asparagiformis]
MSRGKRQRTAREGRITLLEWILEQNDTPGWRTGAVSGERHPEITGEAIEAVGKAELLAQAAALERDGLIRADKREFGSDIARIHYRLEDVGEMYRRAGIPDPREVLDQAKRTVEEYRNNLKNPDFKPFYDELLAQIGRGSLPSCLGTKHFLRGLNAVADNGENLWETQFSARVFGSAKYFRNHLREPILRRLYRYGSTVDEEMGRDEVLAEYGIMTYSQQLECKGPLVLETPDRLGRSLRAFGERFPLGMVLNAQTLEAAAPVELPGVKRVVTIENKANYESMEYAEDTLYIYCHGFFSPKERRFLRRAAALAGPGVEFFHWSDMDYGGIRIYRFMKEKVFERVKPLNMDAASYEKYRLAGAGIPLEEDKRRKLAELCVPELADLKACILEHELEIEQENLLEGRLETHV